MKSFLKKSKYTVGFAVISIFVIGVGIYVISSRSVLSTQSGSQAAALATSSTTNSSFPGDMFQFFSHLFPSPLIPLGPGSGTPTFGGIYFMPSKGDSLSGTSAKEKSDLLAFQNPVVDGVYLRDDWNSIEPTEGVYNWNYLDSQVAVADAAHKKIEISVQAGVHTPPWVFADGAQQFHTITTETAQGNFCKSAVVPVPWDPIFLTKWTAFINAFAAHYANNSNVAVVKITGINITTDETVAPQETGETVTEGNNAKGSNGTCQTNNDVSEWVADGYTGQKVFTAWKTIATAFATAFPHQYLGIMTSEHSFPQINFTTSTADPSGGALSINYFLPAGKQILGNRFIVGQNGARPNHLDASIWNFATSTNTHLGWQPSWPIDSCFDSTGKFVRTAKFAPPCDMNTVIEQLIKEELSSNPNYLEFMTVQLTDADPGVQKALQQASIRLKQSGSSAISTPGL